MMERLIHKLRDLRLRAERYALAHLRADLDEHDSHLGLLRDITTELGEQVTTLNEDVVELKDPPVEFASKDWVQDLESEVRHEIHQLEERMSGLGERLDGLEERLDGDELRVTIRDVIEEMDLTVSVSA